MELELINFWDVERIPFAVVSLVFVGVFGGLLGPLRGNAYPLTYGLLDIVFGGFGDRLDRVYRKKVDLLFRGFLLCAVVIALAAVAAQISAYVLGRYPFYGVTEVLLLSALLSGGAFWSVVLRLYRALADKAGRKNGAYYALARTTRLNFANADDFAIIRAALNLIARHYERGIVAPVFWYLLGGLPFAIIYSFIAALSWRFGKDGFTKGFGGFAVFLDRVLGIVPSILSGALLTLASFLTPTAKVLQAVKAWFGIKNRAEYGCGGIGVCVVAWALGVMIGGPAVDLRGSALNGDWVGPDHASARNSYRHLRRGIFLHVVAYFLVLISLSALYLFSA